MKQTQLIVDFMRKNGSITTMQAFEMGITRLASRIHDLRCMGLEIESETVKAKNRFNEPIHFARYRFAK
jgi:hypothetical protein